MQFQYTSTYSVERIENGFVVRHLEAGRAKHVPYEFDVARQIERFGHDELEKRTREAIEMEAEHAALVDSESVLMQQVASESVPMQQSEI